MGAAESKLHFRKQIYALSEPLKDITDEFWTSFFVLTESPEDVFNLCSQKDIRTIISQQPGNLKLLLQKIVDRIEVFVSSLTKPTLADCKQLLNCIRILTRVLPVVFEQPTDELENEIFWSQTGLGRKLSTQVMKLLFYRGFTIPWSTSANANVQYIIWNKGVGASSAPPTTKEELVNRIEVLRLLITLLSKNMYMPASSETKNPWMIEITVKNDKKAVLGMMCSFLNTIANYDPVGWALLPYNHYLFGDLTEPLVSLCSQCLVALFEFRPGPPTVQKRLSVLKLNTSSESIDSLSNATIPATTSDAPMLNLFQFYLSKIHKQEDLELLVAGITRLLRNPIDASKTYLPGSAKRVSLTNEMITLLWTMVGNNKKFYAHLCQSPQVLVVVQTIINESLDARQDLSKLGIMRLCAFLLQVLSQDRNFGIQLNTLVDVSALGIYGKQFSTFSYGSWGDVVYLFIFIMMSANQTTKQAMQSLQESYLATMANIAPLITKFCAATANRLFTLFTVFSSPRFLLSKDKNHIKLFYFIYVVDTILQYQYAGNAQVVYTFVRNKDKVVALQEMTLESAVDAIMKLTKEEGNGADPNAGLSEKVRGKQPASIYKSPSGFEPTNEWFNEWKTRLPTQVLVTLVTHLAPEIEAFCIENDLNVDTKVLSYLSQKTMVGVLPQPHPIITHSFVYSVPMQDWVNIFSWGSNYMKSIHPINGEIAKMCPPIWTGSKIKLFGISNQSTE